MLAGTGRALRLRAPTATGSTSGRPRSTSRPTPTCSRGRLGRPPAPGAREHAPGVWMQGDVDIDPSARARGAGAAGRGSRVEPVHVSSVGHRRRRGRRSRRGDRPRRCCTIASASVPTRRARLGRRPDACSRRTLAREPTIIGAGVTVGAARTRRRSPCRPTACADAGSVPAMKALVTGGAGFIGSTLVDRLLAEDWRVDVVDDLSTGIARQPRRRPVAARPPVLVPPPRRVVAGDHRAHRAPPARRHLPPRGAGRRARVGRAARSRREVNILGSLNVCEGALAAGVRKVVFAGSGGTLYGTARGDARCARATRSGRSRRTASSKKAVGDYLHYYREVARARVHRARARQRLRPAPGPARRGRRRRDLRGQVARTTSGRSIFGDGAQTRDFVYVDDVVDAFVRAADKGGGLVDEHRHRRRDAACSSSTTSMARLTGFKQPRALPAAAPGRDRAQRARSRPRPRSTSVGSRGRPSTKASPAPSSTSRRERRRSRATADAQRRSAGRNACGGRRGGRAGGRARRTRGRGGRPARARGGAIGGSASASRGFLGAEDRRRDPARREAAVGGGEHEVLDRGAERQQRHAPLGPAAALVGVAVEAVPREAAEHERGRAA